MSVRKHLKLLFSLLILPILLLTALPASAKDAFGLNADERKIVARAQAGLNRLTTVEARFIQATSRGSFTQGRIWMSKPGRLRIDYDPPVEVLIVSDGDTLMFKDEELDQLSYTAFDSTPASLVIGGSVNFFGPNLLITDFEVDQDAVRITVTRSDDPMEGSLTLVFAEQTLQLTRWMVIDAQGIATTISLLDAQFGTQVDDGLFEVEQRSFQDKQDQ